MKKQVAVFTISYNEKYWLPVWVRHYIQQGFNPFDIYVLDNASTDGSTVQLRGCHRYIIDHERNLNWDHQWLVHVVMSFQKLLLDKYDYVVFAEADEFICVDPKVGMNLRTFIDAMDQESVDIPYLILIHDIINKEPSLDLSKPILGQRSLWLDNIPGKSLITRVPQVSRVGFHENHPMGSHIEELRIVHARWADRDITFRRVLERLGNDAGDSPFWGTNNRDKNSNERTNKELHDLLTGKWCPFMRMDQSPNLKKWLPIPISPEWKKVVI